MPKKGQKVGRAAGPVLTETAKAYNETVVECNVTEMSCNDAVRAALEETGTTQSALAQKLGYEGNSTLSNAINSKRMSVEKLLEMLGGLGYSVLVAKDTPDGYALRCVLK